MNDYENELCVLLERAIEAIEAMNHGKYVNPLAIVRLIQQATATIERVRQVQP